MEGVHVLDKPGAVQLYIANTGKLTLKAEHDNSLVVIKCGKNTHGLYFKYFDIINISGITVKDCGQQSRGVHALVFVSIWALFISQVSIDSSNGSGIVVISSAATRLYGCNLVSNKEYGLYLENVCNITVVRSNFIGNERGIGINHTNGICQHLHTQYDSNSIIHITHSNLSNNTDAGVFNLLNNSPSILKMRNCNIENNGLSHIFHDYAGGLYIVSWALTIQVNHCNFLRNYGSGGLHIDAVGRVNAVFWSTTFDGNMAFDSDGGGLRFVFLVSSILVITDCNFTNNVAQAHSSIFLSVGGGLYIAADPKYGHNVKISSTTFSQNNADVGGGILVKNTFMTLKNVTISDNSNSGLHAVSSTVQFISGPSIISNNTSSYDGGGMYLDTSFVNTKENGSVEFYNNNASRFGGAIYSNSDPLDSPFQIHTISRLSGSFSGNLATSAGDNLYGGNFFHRKNDNNFVSFQQVLSQACSNVPYVLRQNIAQSAASSVSSDPLTVCLCIDGMVDCSVRLLEKSIYPGQSIDLRLVSVGLCGGITPGGANIHIADTIFDVISEPITDWKSCGLLYRIKPKVYSPSIITNHNASIRSAHPSKLEIRVDPIIIHFDILNCPPGLMLDSMARDCVCASAITQIVPIRCNVSWLPHPIQKSGRNWMAINEGYNCTIVHDGCPFDYCITSLIKIALNESNLQCNNNRSCILCGQCQPGLSLMLGSNKCTHCENTVYATILSVIGMALAGVILVVLLIVLNLTVSVGTINGVLFYANVVKLNESVLLSQYRTPVITQFIAWLNLDLGIEYCFVDGLDSYVKTWLQFVFPFYLWFLVIAIIIACRYSFKLSRMCGRNAVPVLATLILMSYTKLLRTITNSLMLSQIQCGNKTWQVWNVDGNIQYLGGKHLALFIISILFLITGLIYTGLVFSSQWLQRYSGKCCKSTRDPVVQLKPLIDAYTGPFKDKYRFWTGLCLIVRLLFTIIFSFTSAFQSKLNNYIIVFSIFILSVLSSKVYKDVRISIIEVLSLVNLLIFSFLVILFNDVYPDKNGVNVITVLSVTFEMLLFIIIIVYKRIFQVYNKIGLNFKISRLNHATRGSRLLNVTADTEQEDQNHRREPLIYCT